MLIRWSGKFKLELYKALLRYKYVQKLFHKRKLAVGLIKFKYNYYLYDNVILYERFEPSIKNSNAWYFDKQPKFFFTLNVYDLDYRVVCLIVLLVFCGASLPDQICSLADYLAMTDTAFLGKTSNLLLVLDTIFEIMFYVTFSNTINSIVGR